MTLGKEDFKFSSAHFTLFSADRAERLHGHNYRVVVDLFAPELDELGLLTDLRAVKEAIRSLCARLDEKTLIPDAGSLLETARSGGELTIRFADRRYVIPIADAILLPVANVTIETLARWLWGELVRSPAAAGVARLRVTVAETSGQSASFEGAPGG